MDGSIASGWYEHPQLGLIKIFLKDDQWVYVCYTRNGQKALSRPKTVDNWLWALSEKNEELYFDEEEM